MYPSTAMVEIYLSFYGDQNSFLHRRTYFRRWLNLVDIYYYTTWGKFFFVYARWDLYNFHPETLILVNPYGLNEQQMTSTANTQHRFDFRADVMGSSSRCKGDEVYIFHDHFLCVFFFQWCCSCPSTLGRLSKIGLPVWTITGTISYDLWH